MWTPRVTANLALRIAPLGSSRRPWLRSIYGDPRLRAITADLTAASGNCVQCFAMRIIRTSRNRPGKQDPAPPRMPLQLRSPASCCRSGTLALSKRTADSRRQQRPSYRNQVRQFRCQESSALARLKHHREWQSLTALQGRRQPTEPGVSGHDRVVPLPHAAYSCRHSPPVLGSFRCTWWPADKERPCLSFSFR